MKEKIPYIVQVDKLSGATSLIPAFSSRAQEYKEPLLKSFLARYVTAAESYMPGMEKIFNRRVSLTSTTAVYKKYLEKIAAPAYKSAVKKTPRNGGIRVKIQSVSLLNATSAMVRFTQIIELGQGKTEQRAVATINFANARLPQDEQFLLQNPMGIIIISYRVDEEVKG